MGLDLEALQALPKVSLHDHLDGGLRPQTIIELAADIGHELPAEGADDLGRWFSEAADSGSLVPYLETFDQTIAVMQTAANLRRIAAEFVADLAADGVIYAEVRWAPEQHLKAGLTLAEAVEAVRDGLAEGMAGCRARGQEIEVRQLLTAMRQSEPTLDVAELTLRYRNRDVAGFDLAGPENGYPPSRFLESFQLLRRHGAYYTIHAGESAGPESICESVQVCGANRIGHGVAIIEDIQHDERGGELLGDFAAYVLNRQIPLEMCPSSNVQTGAVASVQEHPIHRLDRLGFRVTVNPDNRLMSATTLTSEFARLAEVFDYSLEDVRRLGINAAKSVFAPYGVRKALVARIASG
ncbi:MAG TPA: adenosine deaminase [Propionibacteriaceae bacterium]|jgi:adenosine deaminase|nr:adenosine deaminase [Propionibacteriaceae bacterium]